MQMWPVRTLPGSMRGPVEWQRRSLVREEPGRRGEARGYPRASPLTSEAGSALDLDRAAGPAGGAVGEGGAALLGGDGAGAVGGADPQRELGVGLGLELVGPAHPGEGRV